MPESRMHSPEQVRHGCGELGVNRRKVIDWDYVVMNRLRRKLNREADPAVIIYRDDEGMPVTHQVREELCNEDNCCTRTIDGILSCQSIALAELSPHVTIGNLIKTNGGQPPQQACVARLVEFRQRKE